MHYLHAETCKRSLREINRRIYHIIEYSIGSLNIIKWLVLKFTCGFNAISNKMLAVFFFLFVEFDRLNKCIWKKKELRVKKKFYNWHYWLRHDVLWPRKILLILLSRINTLTRWVNIIFTLSNAFIGMISVNTMAIKDKQKWEIPVNQIREKTKPKRGK